MCERFLKYQPYNSEILSINFDSILNDGILKKEGALCPIEDKDNAYVGTPNYLWLITDNYFPPYSIPFLYLGKKISRCPNRLKCVYRFISKLISLILFRNLLIQKI